MSYLDIRIPLVTVRILLISSVIGFISFGLLLPLSFFSFNYFYNQLIPNPTITIPLSDYILNYDFNNIPPFIIIGNAIPLYSNQPTKAQIFDDFDFNLNYNFNLEIEAYSDLKFDPIMYKISIVSDHLINQLNPYGIKPYIHKKFNIWPITNNIHQLQNNHVLVSAMNTFILNYNNRINNLNDYLPPFISWLLPPILNNWNLKNSSYNINLFKNIKFNNYLNNSNKHLFDQFNVLIEFNKNLIVNPVNSNLIIDINWNGIRYYLFNYRIISYIFGTASLWVLSNFILLITILSLGFMDLQEEQIYIKKEE